MYLNIVEELKEKIINGEFPADEPLPTQIEFAKMFNTSEITSRRALMELVNEGLIYRVRGKGSFVNKDFGKATDIQNGDNTYQKIKRIYFVYPNISLQALSHRFYQELMDGINERCKQVNIDFQLWNIGKQGNIPDEDDAGFIILTHVQGSKEISLNMIEMWKKENRKIVTVHFYYPHLRIPYVVIDNLTGGYLATQHLLSLGHEKIGIILTGKSLIEINQEFSLRMEGYKLALSQHQIDFNSSYVSFATGNLETEEMGYEGMKSLLEIRNPPTAVVVTSDYKAFGAMEAAKDHGLRVPEDISIVGFDDTPFGKYSSPQLTTINQNSLKLGKRAVELLVENYQHQLNDSILKDEIVPELVIRESTKVVSEMENMNYQKHKQQ